MHQKLVLQMIQLCLSHQFQEIQDGRSLEVFHPSHQIPLILRVLLLVGGGRFATVMGHQDQLVLETVQLVATTRLWRLDLSTK